MADVTYTFERIKSAVVSYARGDYNEKSDIGLRIDKGILKGIFALCGFYSEVEEGITKKC
ncbi:MAG: hypothetical protein NC300_04490 [Bacteroidales bacterium]|nr:hypothetical protein [Clostridium sp.]MCM1203378.1 hypothetical protein [Bacteroidales bacterium]